MKMVDRERLEGTQITIGRRVYKEDGRQKTCQHFSAEYRGMDGRQVTESLGTSNKSQARRKALEIQQRLESGVEAFRETNVTIGDLTERYSQTLSARGVAPKSEAKYNADLDKLRTFCSEQGISLARLFTGDDLYRFHQWLRDQEYADKTALGAVIVTKQAFKWAWRQQLLRDYRLAAASFSQAKAKPQPCFTSAQADQVIEEAEGDERTAFAIMAYAGLRVGEAVQLQWDDLHSKDDRYTMIHVRRGGSRGTTKDKDERFVPVHPKVASLLGTPKKRSGRVLIGVSERTLLRRVKQLCKERKFEKPEQYKLHSFRHHFASLCANHHVAYRKALAWLGHSSSKMLDLYYHLHDEDSQQAMMALASDSEEDDPQTDPDEFCFEGSLRAVDQSTIEKKSQVPQPQALAEDQKSMAERGRFELPVSRSPRRFSKPVHSTALAPLRAGRRRFLPARAQSVHSNLAAEGHPRANFQSQNDRTSGSMVRDQGT
jgi:integrase/recombinase XerD